MKRKIILLNLLFIWIMSYSQGYVGINNEAPKAALDIKAPRFDAEVFRVSTIPDGVDHNKDFFILVGEKDGNDGAYNLRAMNAEDFFKLIDIEIPSLKRIYVTNDRVQNFTMRELNVEIPLNKLVSNTATDLYRFHKAEGAVEILEAGYYEVSAWVGVAYVESIEDDFLLSIAKKNPKDRGRDKNEYKNFKRAVVSRSRNGYRYEASNGVGSSFAFVERFEKGDKVIPRINPTRISGLRTLIGSVSMAITRVDKGNSSSIIIP